MRLTKFSLYRISVFFLSTYIPSKILSIARTTFPFAVNGCFNNGCGDCMSGAIACPHLFNGGLFPIISQGENCPTSLFKSSVFFVPIRRNDAVGFISTSPTDSSFINRILEWYITLLLINQMLLSNAQYLPDQFLQRLNILVLNHSPHPCLSLNHYQPPNTPLPSQPSFKRFNS